MSFGTILYTILISPLQMFFEFIFEFAQRFTNNPGISIIVLSLVMNFLVLPLYKRADAMQAEERDTEAKLHDGLAHIKKAFSGDERMMIQQEYYRRNNYKTMDAFKGSISLFLEIPFFIAAYQFLSKMQALQDVSFGPITNLGAPDQLLTIGAVTLNVLPILMTVINVISCIIYTKGYPLKTKIQLYAMAAFFLFFLYDSPAGLLFYWTLNNVFSLVKNIFYKLKHPKKVLAILSSITGIVCAYASHYFFAETIFTQRSMALVGIAILLQLPLVLLFVKKKAVQKEIVYVPNKKLFLLSALFLAVVLGLLIPSSVIKTSPQEFVDIYNFHNPLWYIASAFSLSFGTCVIWFGVFYWLASSKGKVLFEKIIWALCGISVVDYMFFGTELGILSSTLVYEIEPVFTKAQMLINLVLLLMLCVVMTVVIKRYKKFTVGALATGIIAVGGMSVMNTIKINDSITPLKTAAINAAASVPDFKLSKTGKNVVVLMLDRAMGPYIPYLFNEKPELAQKFDGFTYYENTVSFGGYTNFGAPALFGGYEYTPQKLNENNTEPLVVKHNEAIKVLPVLFNQNGYDVSVCDIPYGNYQWITDLSMYSDYPSIKTYKTMGSFDDVDNTEISFKNNCRNFFCYSLTKTSPLMVQSLLYNEGQYNHKSLNGEYVSQAVESSSESEGIDKTFMASYNVLKNLNTITSVSDSSTSSFVMMDNDITHALSLLQEPEYEPKQHVDNTEFDAENTDRFTVNGRTMDMSQTQDYQHYEMNMAALIQLGNWFDYLRENGVYDNTKIILVSDHGRNLNQFDELKYTSEDGNYDLEYYAPLLMVKDYGSKGFETSSEFMTNGDVATLATEGTIENATNPFTGKSIDSSEKTAHDQYVITSEAADVSSNNGTQFLPSDWLSVHDNIWDKSNWNVVAKDSTSPTNN